MHIVLWIFEKLYSSILNCFKCKEQNGSLTKFQKNEKLTFFLEIPDLFGSFTSCAKNFAKHTLVYSNMPVKSKRF